ncbi:hypothetical protein [Kitasatospora sp. NPDC088134]|uniref:hypothetical protein n=1 Tax=Kitasatospora sp. NPDC088134 TaxID=3364071 RepID=UPI00380DD185
MSHELQPLADAPDGREVRIGWDAPLATYFLQVLDVPPADSDEEIIETVWEGGAPHEHPEPELLVALASQYATVPDDLVDTLRADKAADGEQFAGRVGTHFVGETSLSTVTDADRFARISADLETPQVR